MIVSILAFTCIRNEGPFLLEWIAYHRLIGVTDFLFFSNDCTDGSDLLLSQLADHGVLRHVAQEIVPGKSPQWQALQQVAGTGATERHDWAMFCDVDEFPMVHVGGQTLTDAIAGMPADADAIALTWRLFGAGGQIWYRDIPVTGQFTRSAPPDLFHPIAGRSIKTLYRPSRFHKPGVHRPKRPAAGPVPVWVDGAGRRLPESFARGDGQVALPWLTAGRSIIELNHYSLRSIESFLVKVERGLANRRTRTIDLGYWIERNFNTVENTAMAAWTARLAAEIAALRDLPGVAALHDQACAWHKARAAALMRTQEGYRLFCHCLHAAGSAAISSTLARQLYTTFAEIAPAAAPD
ncbi:hypothetical protein MASR2M74_18860 [Paracoccaceae bacterium]